MIKQYNIPFNNLQRSIGLKMLVKAKTIYSNYYDHKPFIIPQYV